MRWILTQDGTSLVNLEIMSKVFADTGYRGFKGYTIMASGAAEYHALGAYCDIEQALEVLKDIAGYDEMPPCMCGECRKARGELI